MNTEQEPAKPLQPASKVRLTFAKPLRWITILALSLASGIATAFIEDFIRSFFTESNIQVTINNSVWRVLYTSSILVGISLFLLMVLAIYVPKLWRKVVGASFQRAIIYTTIQIFGIAVGLMISNKTSGFWLTFFIVFSGSRIWWSWERRWRGVGRSPSLRSGILRPIIHPGQVWFAFVPGEKETKNRPIMVLRQAENSSRWIIVYFTTQAPKYYSQMKTYLEVKAEDTRGMKKDSWVNIADLKTIRRNQFRTYIGLAPKALYEEVCRASNIEPDPLSWTIDETTAGQGYGPIEAEFRRAIGLDSNTTDPRQSVEGLRDVFKGLLKLNLKN